MIKPGTIFNMQMNGHFPVCALVPDISTEEDLYYVLNLETGEIDFEGALDEINDEIEVRRHRIIASPKDVYKQIETENNRRSKFFDDLYDINSSSNAEAKLKRQLHMEMHALEMIKTRTLNLIALLKDEEIDTRYAFDDLKNWVIQTERKVREAVDFIEREYQEIEYKETEDERK
ncbi:hypothetical protein JEM51_11290 [Ligilactobacillus agilis]|uniref:hypothetical protein n=1 Tax=Ligilactobacillus agilis TaxID=1601 RepID=UPI00191EFDE3|nr:hypothetical protein [Ligilactobacillus agilis]MBL1056979.1 hypothetical protein [Ligilactobacillus agilis]